MISNECCGIIQTKPLDWTLWWQIDSVWSWIRSKMFDLKELVLCIDERHLSPTRQISYSDKSSHFNIFMVMFRVCFMSQIMHKPHSKKIIASTSATAFYSFSLNWGWNISKHCFVQFSNRDTVDMELLWHNNWSHLHWNLCTIEHSSEYLKFINWFLLWN